MTNIVTFTTFTSHNTPLPKLQKSESCEKGKLNIYWQAKQSTALVLQLLLIVRESQLLLQPLSIPVSLVLPTEQSICSSLMHKIRARLVRYRKIK